ncbi:hypothetical protein C8R46DRAFT_1141413 [Mycena filopes]|nr:hypothetical protein C8R46DRAFT_1141413 [Mycena filopes]
MSASEAPMLLGRICGLWRAIALSTPRLWARLHLVDPYGTYAPDPTMSDAKAAQRFAAAEAWLGRSGDCPLTISLWSGSRGGLFEHDPPPDNASPPPPTPPFLHALIPFAARWRHIDITLSLQEVNALATLTHVDVPLLETIAFHDDFDFPTRPTGWENLGILYGPRITSFCAPVNEFAAPAQGFLLRWSQLTVLKMDGPPPWQNLLTSEKVLDIVGRCPELRICRLVVNPDIDPSVVHLASPVPLEFLHTLEVHMTYETVTPLLNKLYVPELRDLTLRAGTRGWPNNPSTTSLADILSHWPRLERLEIDSNGFSEASLVESLRSLPPAMKKLKIHDIPNRAHPGVPTCSLTDDVLNSLTPALSSPTPICCPALETIEISNCIALSDAAILRFITARMVNDHCRALTRVNIQFHREMVLDIQPDLEPFIASGLDVSIGYPQNHWQPRFSPWDGLPDAPIQQWGYTVPV